MAIGGQVVHVNQRFGSLLISSPQGQSGKTIVTIGLCNALKRRGILIQPFKKGPDYIDPSWLTVAAGRSCRNLDLFLIPKDKLIKNFQQTCEEVDLALIEGAMGLYDGLDLHGTTAEIARLLHIPIILVVNTTRMTSSIAAMVSGYQRFQPDIHIAGVILNHVSGSRHESKLKNAVERYCGIPVVGSIPRDSDLDISQRHLGLIPFREAEESELTLERICQKIEPHLDLDNILEIARRYSPHPTPLPVEERGNNEDPLPRKKGDINESHTFNRKHGTKESPLPWGERDGVRGVVKIGVMLDRVFNFYYPENLEALSQTGAELIFINSLKDRLPEIDGLYIGGGFPEFFLAELEANEGLRGDIAEAIEDGLPVYAECAGLMYLCRRISWQDRSYEMVGIIPSEVLLSEKPQGHGYVVAEVTNENPLFPVGLTIQAHEFHHSKLSITDGLKFAYQIRRGQGITDKKDGIIYKNLFASYVHLHALGTPEWAEGFLSLASKGRKANPKVHHGKDEVCLG